MSKDFWIDFKTVVVEMPNGFCAGILFDGKLIQSTKIHRTSKQAEKQLRSFSANFIKSVELASREIGYTIDKTYQTKNRKDKS